MNIKFHINPSAALKAGYDACGTRTIDILASEIPVDLREELALHPFEFPDNPIVSHWDIRGEQRIGQPDEIIILRCEKEDVLAAIQTMRNRRLER